MKKNLPLILVVLLLGSILAYLKYTKSSTNYDDVTFRVDDIDAVGSISITDKQGGKVQFTQRDKSWWINDSTEADRVKMLMLLATIQKLQIENPVGDSMRKYAIEDLRQFGKEVKILDKNGEEIKTFFIGNSPGSGNFMILSEDGIVQKEPYIVKIPGVKSVDLKHRFPSNPEAWYSAEVFATPIDKIASIKVLFLDQPEYSFILTKDEELVKIDPLVDSVRIDKPLNQEHVVQFLLEFEQKNFDARVKDDTSILYIKQAKPVYRIELTDVFNQKQAIDLYRIPSRYLEMAGARTQMDAKGETLPFSLDKYWAYLPQKKQYAVAQHYVFGPMLLPYMYFFEKGK